MLNPTSTASTTSKYYRYYKFSLPAKNKVLIRCHLSSIKVRI
jgi:hypothetical protein